MNLLIAFWIVDKLLYGNEDERYLAKCMVAAIIVMGIVVTILYLLFCT